MPSSGLPLPEDTESALLARWRAGDRVAGLGLMRRQIQPIRRYFARRVACPADAEDLAQRTLLVSSEALPRFPEEVALPRFVRAVASKLLLRYRRDHERARMRLDAEVQPDAVETEEPSAFAWVCREDDLQRLRSAIREVPDDSARLLHLRYWEEQDTSEIARLLELEPGAVRTRLHRARHQMKRVLTAMAGPEEQAVETDASGRRVRRGRCSTPRGQNDRRENL